MRLQEKLKEVKAKSSDYISRDLHNNYIKDMEKFHCQIEGFEHAIQCVLNLLTSYLINPVLWDGDKTDI